MASPLRTILAHATTRRLRLREAVQARMADVAIWLHAWACTLSRLDMDLRKVHSANITPHPEAGIGKWTEEQFGRALTQGLRPDGSPGSLACAHLLPENPEQALWRELDPVPAGFDPLDHVQGFESYARHFADARSPGEVEGIKRRIRSEEADRDVLRRAGIGGPAAEIGLNLLDPSFAVAIAVPELAIAKAGRIGRAAQAAVEGAAIAGTYETAQQGLQETRTGVESAFSVGAGALLGGLLGGLLRRVPAVERPQLDAAAHEAIRSEVGAAAVRRPTTLEAETLAHGGDAFARIAGKLPLAETDAQRILRSESVEARTVLQELADVPGEMNKNLEGIASPTSGKRERTSATVPSLEPLSTTTVGIPATLSRQCSSHGIAS